MRNLYIDFDGVILDTISVSTDLMNKAGIPLENRAQVMNFFANLDWQSLLENTSEINDSINCIYKLIASNKFEVTILTHINSLNEAIEKIHYIRRFFPDITIIHVPKLISKTKMVHTKNAILVDDFVGNLQEWESEGGIPVRFSRKLDGKGYKVIDHLDQLLEFEF